MVGTMLPLVTPGVLKTLLWLRPLNGAKGLSVVVVVNEQPAHPAELAGKPPSEGTKVLVMKLLEFRRLADVA